MLCSRNGAVPVLARYLLLLLPPSFISLVYSLIVYVLFNQLEES